MDYDTLIRMMYENRAGKIIHLIMYFFLYTYPMTIAKDVSQDLGSANGFTCPLNHGTMHDKLLLIIYQKSFRVLDVLKGSDHSP